MTLKIFLVFFLKFVFAEVAAQTDCSSKVDGLSIKDSAVPVKGKALQLNCIVNNFKDSSNIILTRSDLQANEQITQCITSFCANVPFKWRQSYTVSSDNNGVYLQIKSLNRSEDENTWICTNSCGENKSLQFTVHTVPHLLQFDNPPSQDKDLVHNAVTLKCSTRCAYPQPSFTWFYNETGDSRQKWSNSGSVSNKAGECTDSERIYTSTLSLPRYTTFPDNADKTVNFSCGIISFPGLTQSLYTGSYVNVRFAVNATTPTITGHTTENRVVFENDTITLECISSITRPVALVTWKKGFDNLTNIQNTVTNHHRDLASITSTVTVTLNRNDNNKKIICETSIPGQENKANTQQGITVYWPPSTPSIPTTNLPFLEGQSGKSIYCQATEYGNPTAIANWSSEYGTPNSSNSRQLNLPKLSSQQNGILASCQLKNQFTDKKSIQIQSPVIKIEVEYLPVVNIVESNIEITTVTKNEGQNISILCNANGNPVPTVRWIGRTPGDKYLRFDDLDRSDHGTYTCKASAKSTNYPHHNFETEKKLNVVVNFRVASVILKDGSSLPAEPIEVVSGVSKTLTCTTSASRPNATIAWYIGEDMKQSSCISTFTFTPEDGDHKKQIFCKANNTKAANEAVSSNKFTLYVKVRVTSVTLKDGDAIPTSTLKVTSGISKTLICTTSASRPTSTIIWYIGMEEKKRSTASTSSLTFTPENSDNGNQVYCKAFNLQLENQAVSSNKPSLFVKEPTTVKLFYIGERNGQANFTAEEHDVIQFTCEVGGDPASNVKIIFEGEILAEQADTNKLTFIRQDVDCLHSGVYFCEGNDSNGLTSSKNVTLIVKCSPRPRRQILRNITSPLYVPVTLTFKAIAYPEPGPKGFYWYKENKKGWIPLLSNEDLHLSSSGLQTSLTIMNVSRAHFGQYRVTAENSIGTYDQYLFLSGEGLTVVGTETSKDDKECTTSVVIAVTLGIICAVLAGYATGITILHRRKMTRKGTKFPDKTTAEITYVNSAYKSDVPKVPGTVRRHENIDDANGINEDSLKQYTDLAQYSRDDITTYDVIQKI